MLHENKSSNNCYDALCNATATVSNHNNYFFKKDFFHWVGTIADKTVLKKAWVVHSIIKSQ